ncbi:PREDICTED: uncharacterized protein LOC109241272 [Nicotiana attenuata]|uniref:uncharacterized protein LOC109241272 n=1 Tax=Nicotiana attenuata TaxID=49451 RepID=UPI0009055741|nr:PREDICTED: uncharacterized protein LOC109241272 [Nicotiana attenuata]
MTWVIWNVRGINKRYKQKELKIYVQNKQIKLAGFLETRVKENRDNRVFKNILPGWAIQNNYQNAINGRIWLTWDHKVYCIDVEKIDAQLIHCTVRGRMAGFEACLTLVYGYNTVEQRKSLWSNLNDISKQVTKPWLIGEYFNAMLYTQDRMYGKPVAISEMVDFSDCIHNLFLNEVAWKGEYYTWSNKQQGDDRILSRIDRVFGNDLWISNWGYVCTEYDVPLIYDHSPMLLNIKSIRSTIKPPFRFFNVWTDHKEFGNIVKSIWNRRLAEDEMENAWKKLKALKPLFKRLNLMNIRE